VGFSFSRLDLRNGDREATIRGPIPISHGAPMIIIAKYPLELSCPYFCLTNDTICWVYADDFRGCA
jgi:hypothetical protein